MGIVTDTKDGCKQSMMESLFSDFQSCIKDSARAGTATHEFEKDIFERLMAMGHQALECFFELQGDGDVGETFTVKSGETYKRLKNRTRGYQSIFGHFELSRAVYGTHESKKIEVVPLDARLQLPHNEHSYLLQEWSQLISVEVPFKKTMEIMKRIFPISITVDTLEQTNQSFAEHAASFREKLDEEIPKQLDKMDEEESEALKESLLVLSADGKGVPIRHPSDAARIESHQSKRGPKPDRKRMAVVGSSYVVAPYIRTPEQVLEALFTTNAPANNDLPKRPIASHKSVVANLTREVDGKELNATSATFDWLKKQSECFSGHVDTPPVVLMDGQISLWNEIKRQMPGDEAYTEVLDLLHAISRLWDVTHVFYSSDDKDKFEFMKERVLRTLDGEIKGVISGVRQMATKRNLSKSKREKMEVACRYLENNSHRMKYNKYLAQGFPIASGVIEGACLHFVKDRMERAGMQWTITGAQSMLDVRAIKLNGDWDKFIQHRIDQELGLNYAHNDAIKKIEWPMRA